MEELSEKIDQVLAAVAAQSAALPPSGCQRGGRLAVARLRDGTQEPIELTADLRLGIGDDAERIAEQLRQLRGLDVEAVELPKTLPHKEFLQWAEQLSNAFFKAWSQRVDHVEFIEKVCQCGEGLMSHRQHSLAYSEVYNRLSDRLLQLKGKLNKTKEVPDVPRVRTVGLVARFMLGRCMALYQTTTRRDPACRREDTVEALRDVLRDLLSIVKFIDEWEVSLREELYWAVYNTSVLALRVARFLRLHGFPGFCVQALNWLMQSMNSCLPMMAVHMVPLRVRFLTELVYCAESAMQLGEASRLCDAAIEQLEKDQKLETMLEPVPEETLKAFETALARFRVLKIKYDFWLEKVADAKQVITLTEDLGAKSRWVLPSLLEVFEIQHGLPKEFGTSAPEGLETGAPDMATAEDVPEVTKIGLSKIRARQRELLEVILERVRPHIEKAEAAARALEDFTARRLAFDAEEERRARSDEVPAATADENGEPPEPITKPDLPSRAELDDMGFSDSTPNHSIEEAFPLATHIMLARECLWHEMQSGGANLQGKFKWLERSLAVRLRYRHFLCPPIIDVDVLVSSHKSQKNVALPQKYDFLTDDLNLHSHRNRQIEAGEAGDNGGEPAAGGSGNRHDASAIGSKAKGKHIFVIGQRFDAWESWTAGGVSVPIRRLCDLRVVFSSKPPPVNGRGPANSVGMFDAGPMAAAGGASVKPWSAPYVSAGAADSSGFDHSSETSQLCDSLLSSLSSGGHLKRSNFALPIDPHPGSQAVKAEAIPYLRLGFYDEGSLWTCDEEAHKELSMSAQLTLSLEELEATTVEAASGAAALEALRAEDADAGPLLPPLCQLLDNADVATTPITDLAIFATKHLHVQTPSERFNAVVRTDLRQTPGELLGRPFQSYIFACVGVGAPSATLCARRLRILRAFHAAHVAFVAPPEEEVEGVQGGGDAPPVDGDETQVVAAPQWKRPAVIDRLLEFGDALERAVAGTCGRLFLLDAADILEDVCGHAFLQWVWPRLKSIQDMLRQHELKERMISEKERKELDEWSMAVRNVLPLLLRILEQIRAIDSTTLGAAAFALAKLFHDRNDSRSGQAELGMAIARLEDELAEASLPGPQPRLDRPVAYSVSFDPPSIRSPGFALFDGPGDDEADPTLLLKPFPRSEQDRFCLLTRLYASWIDVCLKTHLKNVGSTIKRARHPTEGPEEEDNHLGPDPNSTKLAMSNQETAVLSRLGENPYLRCLLFVAVARRRPDVASTALAKACQEVEAAVAQEQHLWSFSEKELGRQQRTLRGRSDFANEFTAKSTKSARKPRADPPLLFGRSPGVLRLRIPPLLKSGVPPILPSSLELEPQEQAYSETKHSEKIGIRLAAQTPLTCVVFGKPAGTGTAVSELHRELPGTGLRRFGYDFVEISGLRPNTNYTFAAMYFEGFEAARPAASAISETSPPMGSYFPLPLTLLRIEICKQALRGGEACKATWTRVWGPLFDGLCERTTRAEEFDAFSLRTFKLRLDVADRLPPAILAAFAELVMLKNGNYGVPKEESIPSTKSVQQAALRSANECLIAVDCARRAGSSHLTLQGVSLTLKLVSRLLQYRTKPPILLTLLTKCATCLEAFDPTEEQMTWYAKARVMATYLFHHIAVLCVQLRQKSALSGQLEKDAPRRYSSHALADAGAQVTASARLLDQALELALLGSSSWQFAEQKASVALKDVASEDLARMLKDISDREYVKVAKEAAQRLLDEDGERHPLTLALMRSAATRTWEKEETREALATVLERHPLREALDNLLVERRKGFTEFGFLLRSLPLVCLQPEPEKPKDDQGEAGDVQADGQPDAGDAVAPSDGGVAPDGEEAPPAEPPLQPAERLEQHDDSTGLAQLELMRAGPSFLELCKLSFHWQDISRFKFFDLQQVTVPQLFDDGATLGGVAPPAAATEEMGGAALAGEVEGNGEAAPEPDQWELKENEDKESRAKAFELLKELLPSLVRGAVYASAKRADQLLQTMLLVALNALLIVSPSPAECVPSGPQSNPQDIDPDKHVGADCRPKEEAADGEAAAEGAAAAAEGDDAPPPEAEIWLNLAMLAELAVRTLTRMKAELAPPPPRPMAKASAKRKASAKQAAGARGKAAARGASATSSKDITAVPGRIATSKAASATSEKDATLPPGQMASTAATVLEEDEETRVIRIAKETSEELGAADEELHEMWFEAMPDLDITSIAKLVAFAVLCLYHMRRWSNVIVLCRSFNDATCFAFATTFLPLIIGAQSQVCNLSSRALANTERYLAEAKSTFEADQKALPRKVLRQLALQGELSEPEKLFKKRAAYYDDLAKRQKRLHSVWDQLFHALESSRALVAKAVPAAMEQLRSSRVMLAEYLQDRQDFSTRVARGLLADGEKLGQERALRLASVALMSSYKKAVELLRKRQMTELVVQALHELGNLQWLEGDSSGAQTSWSDAVDAAYRHVSAIKDWQKCIESAVAPPQTPVRTEMMLLSVVVLAKHTRLTAPKDSTAHLHAALFASAILEAILTNSLPHPSHRILFSLDKYRLREIFCGLRESRLLLPPNSVHGGVDGLVFLGALSFFHDTLLVTNYQTSRCLPICSLYNYIATDICRNHGLVVKGRLMMARALIKCQAFDSAWFVLYGISKSHDQPRSLLTSELMDRMIAEMPDAANGSPYAPYRTCEEPFSENNKQALTQLFEFSIAPGDQEARDAFGSHNLNSFKLLLTEFLISIGSSGRVFTKVGDAEEVERLGWLEKADGKLRELWKEVTGNDDDIEALASSDKAEGGQPPAMPTNALGEQESELCVEIRLLLAHAWEARGNLGRAVLEVLYAMRFVQLLATSNVKSSQDCNMGGSSSLRMHPGAKVWNALRRRMVQLLVAQGRYKAADAHIEQGLQECQSSNDDITRIELLASKVRADVMQGRLLELRGSRMSGAIPAAQCCVILAAKRLPVPPACAVVAKAVLSLLFEQNPALVELASAASPSASEQLAQVIAAYGKGDDPNETLLLDAQGKIIVSPIAQAMQSKGGEKAEAGLWQQLDEMMTQCLSELDSMLAIRGFELHPHHMNGMFDMRGGSVPAAAEEGSGGGAQERLRLLPQPRAGFVERPVSDAREPPNIYLGLMPLRLHCELRLARLKLDVGSIQEAEKILREAESRLSRCVFLLPWLFVQFCTLKFQWRRLTYQLGFAKESPPPDAPNDAVYRDPKAFADGKCPPTDSPLFRTFVRRGRAPSLAPGAEWVPPATREGEDELSRFLQELVEVLRTAAKEGGHDYAQVFALLREGLEEVLRVRGRGPLEPATADLAHALFSALAATAEARKGLFFESASAAPAAPPDPKAKNPKDAQAGGAPPPIDAAQLPARVALDILNSLKRQGSDRAGDLAYSAAACQEAQKSLPFRAVAKHAFSVRRECDVFGSIYHRERLLSDQLHVALTQASDAYVKAKVVDEAQLGAMMSPVETPCGGDVLVHWARPDTGSLEPLPSEHMAFFIFVCASGKEGEAAGAATKPMVARCNDVRLAALRRLADALSADLLHCKPAEAVAAGYVERQLRSLAQVLRGAGAEPESVAPGGDAALDAALSPLLLGLAKEGGEPPSDAGEAPAPELLDSGKVRDLLRALLRLLDHSVGAAKVSHPLLGGLLRAVLAPLCCLGSAGAPPPAEAGTDEF